MSTVEGTLIQSVKTETFSTKKLLGLMSAIVVALIFWFVPMGMDKPAAHAIGIAAFMIIMWAAEVLDVGITAVIGAYLFWATGLAAPARAFSGFANDTTWFMMGVLLIGAMTDKSGLGRRIGYTVLAKAGNTYSGVLFAVIVVDFLLAFIIPSGVARVVIMAGLALGIIKAFGVDKNSNVARGLFIMFTYSATIFDKMLLANPPAILARGIIQDVGHVTVSWSQWFIAYLPINLITIVACWKIALWLYPPETKELPGGRQVMRRELEKLGPWTVNEKKCAFLVLIAVALWMTDFWHHLNPALIGVGIGLAALLPRVGFLNTDDFRKVNLSVFFLVGGAICMTNILIDTKAIDVMTKVMFSWMGPVISNVYHSSVVLYWTAFVYHIFLAVETSMVATSMPPLMQFAVEKGFNPLTIGMIWTFAVGGKIFIYQSAPIVTGYAYGYFTGKDVLKVGALVTVVESILLFLVVPFYWPLIGLNP
jgi:solute carrier family 13 (sodium-dependent dicarboxylate transporter), member 2/3/5